MNIDFERFCALAKDFNLIPIFEEIPADLDTPVSAFLKLRDYKHDFLFESVVGGEKWARYSFVGSQPQKIYSYKNNSVIVKDEALGSEKQFPNTNPFDFLREEFQNIRPYQDENLPRFFGGIVGAVSYDMVHDFDAIPCQNQKQIDFPNLYFFLTDTVVIFDNLGQVMKIVNTVEIPENFKKEDLKKLYNEALEKITSYKNRLKSSFEQSKVYVSDEKELDVESLMDKEEYCEIVKKAKAYIEAGDIFQVVLSNRFTIKTNDLDSFEVYRILRRLNPSPYMYFLEFEDSHIVGASPEILVRLEDQKVTIRPIAGTRKRGTSEEEDLVLEKDLLNDPKEVAEHIMLVDLGRNDVGRVAEIGTVKVEQKMMIEKYSHVMHMVSHVTGELAKNKDVFDVIQAAFPAGTLSGAPKIRAMQIIDELEKSQRGIYGGAVGYVSFTGNTDLAIAIRTALFQNGKAYVQAGAGIVYNSIPESEHQECENKAKGVLRAIEMAMGKK